jgi:beta-lactamase class D
MILREKGKKGWYVRGKTGVRVMKRARIGNLEEH